MVMVQPMDSPSASKDSIHQDQVEEVEATTEKGNPPDRGSKVTWEEENSDIDQERFPSPLLPKEKDDKQPTITSFFTKSPRKQLGERDSLKPVPNGEGKEKVTEKKEKQDVRKLLPRKLIRAAKMNTSPGIPTVENQSDDQDQPNPGEKSTQKEKAQKKVAVAKSTTTKEKGKRVAESSKPAEKEKVKHRV